MISWLQLSDQRLEATAVADAIESLVQLRAAQVTLAAPAQPDEVTAILTMLAETIQVELPERLGLSAYVAVLQELPRHVLEAAAIEILKTHAYRTLPLPAEFLATEAAREWAWVKDWLPRACEQWLARLEKQLDQPA